MKAVLVSLSVAIASLQAAMAASAPEAVVITEGEQTLRGILVRPDGIGPFPAIVGLHACGGLKNSSDALLDRYRDWAEHLSAAGFAVLFPDSYGSRSLPTQCAARSRSTLERNIANDAIAARQWLSKQAWVASDRISLLGWASGGASALWAVRRQAGNALRNGDFRSAVAFYPRCRRLGSTAWSARIPTLILTGRADEWAPAAACEQMVRGARGRSAGVAIVVYPRTQHDFDQAQPPGSVRPGSTGNTAARADALRRAPEWLAR